MRLLNFHKHRWETIGAEAYRITIEGGFNRASEEKDETSIVQRCQICSKIREYRINGNHIKSIRSLINSKNSKKDV